MGQRLVQSSVARHQRPVSEHHPECACAMRSIDRAHLHLTPASDHTTCGATLSPVGDGHSAALDDGKQVRGTSRGGCRLMGDIASFLASRQNLFARRARRAADWLKGGACWAGRCRIIPDTPWSVSAVRALGARARARC